MANQLSIQGPPLASVGEAVQVGPITVTSTITPVFGTVQSVGPASTTIAVPASAAGMALFPPSSNTVALTIKGISADTGYAIPKNAPYFTLFDTTAAGFNLALTTGGAAGTITYVIF